MAPKSKVYRLLDLTAQRKDDVRGTHRSVGEFHGGAYDARHVSPWTKSAENVNAELFLLAQDWASAEYLAGPYRPILTELGHDPSLPTNKNLKILLEKHTGQRFEQTFATNLFPFAKAGGMSAPISSRDLLYAAQVYAIPQIRIVRPRVVVCLGAKTFNALRQASGLPLMIGMDNVVAGQFDIDGIAIVGVAHPGALGMNYRGRAQVDLDWRGLATRFL